MTNKRSFLTTEQFLRTNEYLVSNNGLFFAIMQGDGNFCVYRGTGELGERHNALWAWSDKATSGDEFFAIMQCDGNFCVYRGTGELGERHNALWCYTNRSRSGDDFYAILQDDGNFCVYEGTGPTDSRGVLWSTNATDPIDDIEIESIEYDVSAAKILQSGPTNLHRQTVTNNTEVTQTNSITGSQSISVTSGWSDSLGVKVGVKTEFNTGIPIVAGGKVEVSVDVTNTYTWNGSTTKTKTWGFDTPVSVPPHMTMVCLVSTTLSDIVVPYTLTGTVILKSGTRMPAKIRGTYTGTDSHDLTVTFIQQDPVTAEISSLTQMIEATSG
jgi:hypothetical protein